MDWLELLERDGREGKAAPGPTATRRGGIRGFFDRLINGAETDSDDRANGARNHGDDRDDDGTGERDRYPASRAYDRDARTRRRDNDGFDFD